MPPFRRTAGGTYCPRLWDEIFIDQKGEVYACCCSEAQAFGNIYRDRLRRIFDSGAARALRKKSLNGTLKCYERCFLLNKAALPPCPPSRPLTAPYKGLKRIKLRFGELCNIKCVMCVQGHRSPRALDMATLRLNLDLGPFQSVEMEGGEPLFIKPAREFFDYAVSQGKKVSFLSNGTLITDDWAEKIARHSRFIYISINAATRKTHELVNVGSRWGTVLRNVRRIREYRDALHSGTVIQGHMTLVRENIKEAPLFIRKFKALGFDRICFCHSESAVKYLHENTQGIIDLKEGIETAYSASKNKADINLSGLAPMFKAALRCSRGENAENRPRCSR